MFSSMASRGGLETLIGLILRDLTLLDGPIKFLNWQIVSADLTDGFVGAVNSPIAILHHCSIPPFVTSPSRWDVRDFMRKSDAETRSDDLLIELTRSTISRSETTTVAA